ncbi:Hsp20/alpha crystallin family protein [Planctomycetota bacterium]
MLLNNRFSFYDMDKMLDEMDRLFNAVNRPLGLRSVPRGTFPPVNVYDKGDHSVVVAEIPGIDPEQLELTVLNDTVTLSGERFAEDQKDTHVYRRERAVGEFSRTINLPDAVNPDSVSAEYKDGILRVTMAKAEAAKARQIPIKS